jgi:hypothetical protein
MCHHSADVFGLPIRRAAECAQDIAVREDTGKAAIRVHDEKVTKGRIGHQLHGFTESVMWRKGNQVRAHDLGHASSGRELPRLTCGNIVCAANSMLCSIRFPHGLHAVKLAAWSCEITGAYLFSFIGRKAEDFSVIQRLSRAHFQYFPA